MAGYIVLAGLVAGIALVVLRLVRSRRGAARTFGSGRSKVDPRTNGHDKHGKVE